MYCDIMCHKLWTMVVDYFLGLGFVDLMAKLLKRIDSVVTSLSTTNII